MKKIIVCLGVLFLSANVYAAQITINIPDGVLSRVLNAIAAEYNYPVNKLEDETKGQFAKRMLLTDWVKRIVRDQEGRAAGSMAENTAKSNADSEVNNNIN